MQGSGPLNGDIPIGGAKNSALKLMAASLLAEGSTSLLNVPDIADVAIMSELLEAMGVEIERIGDRIDLDVPAELDPIAPYSLVERMRASIAVLGPLLARIGHARVAMPGGDDFGSRPIDMHLQGLEQLGATFSYQHGDISGEAHQLVGAEVFLEFPSVGATENLMMAAVKAGADRQEVHELIRRHSKEAARRIKSEAAANDLIERLQVEPVFAGIDLDSILDPSRYIGRAPHQVDAFIEKVVDPIRKRYPDRGERRPELRV